MSLQWKRECIVIIGGKTASDALVIQGLEIKFEITKTITKTPNPALISIYNMSGDDVAKIEGEYDEVIVNAGYEGDSALIFAGNIRHTFVPREETDFVTQIDAADGDEDLKDTVISTALSAGHTVSDELDHIISQFKSTKAGHIAIKDQKRIRGRTIVGPAHKLLDQIAAMSDAHWSVQDGHLIMVPVASTLPTEAIVINEDTGMLDAPELDNVGIKVRCLLNAHLRIGGKVKLDNNTIRERVTKDRSSRVAAKPKKPKKKELAHTDPDGIYKVYKIVHRGDTRGEEWDSEVWCVALDQPIPAGRTAA